MYNVEGLEWFMLAVRSLRGKRVCELGNQHIWDHAAERFGIPHTVARDWMLDEGAEEYVSIDLNGQDGALQCDLSHPRLPSYLHGQFDVVTNIGTSEHVIGHFPFTGDTILRAQGNCFANMFMFCANGGTMIHQVPPVGYWKGHCFVHYKPGFPQAFALACGSPLTGSELVQLPTLNPDSPLLMFTVRKEPVHFTYFDVERILGEIAVKIPDDTV